MKRTQVPQDFRIASLGSFLIAAAVAGSGDATARADMLSGFDTGADLQRWSAIGEIRCQRLPVIDPPAAEGQGGGPEGGGVRITTAGQAGFFIKAGELPADVTRFDTLRFWVHRDPAAAAASTIEVRFYEPDGGVHFWRAVRLDHAGWKQVEVPFKWTRWSDSRIPRWERVNRLGLFFRDPADIVVDSFSLADDPPPNAPGEGPVLGPADVGELAFGGRAEPARVVVRDGIAVVTDAPQLAPERLLDHLRQVADAITADLPFVRLPGSPVVLLVFADEEDYRRFPATLAARLGAQARQPEAAGFTVQGIATSSWDPRHGTLRPVYTHEFVHAMLSAMILLDNKSEWFQEGLAANIQLRFHPQPGFEAQLLRELDAAGEDILRDVCDGEPIPLERYWVAATLCRMLQEDPELAARLPQAVAAMQKSGSTRLEPVLPLWGLTWDELDGRWRAFCRKTYAQE
jgi:hypothetical protein